MFEFVRTHTRILQFVLVLLIFPSFVFFGIQGYSRFTEGTNASVAKVDGHAITQGEWDAAHRNQIERTRRQVMAGLGVSTVAPASATNAALEALLQQREVQLQRFDTKDYLAKVNPSDAEVEAYYKANNTQFQAPEQASIEYVVFDLDALKKGITVPEEELRKYYDSNASRYTVAEERRASHILVKADKSAPAAERAKAKAKAESR